MIDWQPVTPRRITLRRAIDRGLAIFVTCFIAGAALRFLFDVAHWLASGARL